jgi:hypothetical protein
MKSVHVRTGHGVSSKRRGEVVGDEMASLVYRCVFPNNHMTRSGFGEVHIPELGRRLRRQKEMSMTRNFLLMITNAFSPERSQKVVEGIAFRAIGCRQIFSQGCLADTLDILDRSFLGDDRSRSLLRLIRPPWGALRRLMRQIGLESGTR